MLSDRDATGDNKDMTFHSALNRFDQSFALVGAMFGRYHTCAALPHQCLKQCQIAVVNLSLIKSRSWHDDLVTGRYDCHVYLAADCHIGEALRREKGDGGGANTLATFQNFMAFRSIATSGS